MTRYLLDVNVLIALIDPTHMQHDRAHAWFSAQGKQAWATCPLTENGVVRIVSQPRYPNSPGTPAAVAEIVTVLRTVGNHEFWPDTFSLLDRKRIDISRLLEAGQITDSYLLALAATHGGKLATFDQALVTNAVIDGAKELHLIR